MSHGSHLPPPPSYPAPSPGRPRWYRRKAVLIPVATGLLGLGIGATGSSSTTAATSAAPATTATVTSTATVTRTATAAAVAPTAPAAVTQTVTAPPQQIRVTVTRTVKAGASSSRPAVGSGGGLDPRFPTCKAAKAAGYGHYRQGEDPEYAWYRDADHDGVVCE